MPASKRVVIWDVDDVLNDLMGAWFETWWRPRHAECRATVQDLTANPPHGVLAISEAEYLGSLDAFREERFPALAPRPEVIAWFTSHGDRSHHIALTAVPPAFAHLSAGWVMRHFGSWIRTFAFVPARRGQVGRPDAARAKADYLSWLGRGDVFIDDRPDNVNAARAAGLRGIVVPRPWNDSPHVSFDAALRELTELI